MSFFQNLFLEEFRGNWVLGDRQHIPTFVCPPNHGRGTDSVTAWKEGPYDLSVNDADGNARGNLVLVYTVDFKNWAELSINIAGATPATTTPEEVITALNSNEIFAGLFEANSQQKFSSGATRIFIRQKLGSTRLKFYVQNGRAEEAIAFNYKAGVVEMPSYFMRHTVGKNTSNVPYAVAFSDGLNALVYLNEAGWAAEGDTVAGDVIYHAVDQRGKSLGFDPTAVQDDYELLKGRSGIFNFQKVTVDVSDRITQIIEYPTGAQVGDFARKVIYTYTGANTNPSEIMELPHVLVAADLITPP